MQASESREQFSHYARSNRFVDLTRVRWISDTKPNPPGLRPCGFVWGQIVLKSVASSDFSDIAVRNGSGDAFEFTAYWEDHIECIGIAQF